MDYDSYLANCVENYMNPQVCELTIKGRSLYDLIAIDKDGKEEVFFNVPLNYWKNIDVSDDCEEHPTYYPRWDEVCDDIENDYFDFSELEYFEFDEVLNESETYLPNDYNISKIIGFSKGHSFEDLTVEE